MFYLCPPLSPPTNLTNPHAPPQVILKGVCRQDIGEGASTYVLREISLLRELSSHPSILKIFNAVPAQPHQNDDDTQGVDAQGVSMWLVQEHMPMDLRTFINTTRTCRGLSPLSTTLMDDQEYPLYHNQGAANPTQVRSIMRQLLSALQYMHGHGVMHRDLRPKCVYVCEESPGGAIIAKLSCFELARGYIPDEISHVRRLYTHEVVNLCYRPPEILLGAGDFSLDYNETMHRPTYDPQVCGCLTETIWYKYCIAPPHITARNCA